MGWMYYYDYYFLILVVPAMLIALWAQIKVKTTFASQSKRLSSRGLTGAQAVNAGAQILRNKRCSHRARSGRLNGSL